ncbi:hypothetical protein [Streptomyces sp. NPDC008001]|uniref:hypothetical protein n=1 Tax=Streptomyces sp. NPDC008001 TaxID=3364804 RepID=UPI0036EE7BAF
MPRTRTIATSLAALAGLAALTGCSSEASGEGAGKPITQQLSQGQITQALPGAGEVISEWEPYRNKGVVKAPDSCALVDSPAPKGWVRAGRASYLHNGSTDDMAYATICLFDGPDNAKSAYAAWQDKNLQEQDSKDTVGEESVFLVDPDAQGTVYALSRSGSVAIKVEVQHTRGDTTGAHDMIAATLKRLQQVQDGERATATAADEAAKAAKK